MHAHQRIKLATLDIDDDVLHVTTYNWPGRLTSFEAGHDWSSSAAGPLPQLLTNDKEDAIRDQNGI